MSAASALLLLGCQNDDTENPVQQDEAVLAHRGCATDEVHEQMLRDDPSLALKMNDIEELTQRAMDEGRLVNGKIQIPVVVNVLYRTTAENLSLTRIQQQIDILNKDFNAANAEYNTVPSLFSARKANIGISFVLSNVYRKSTSKTSWGTNNDMKKTAMGGLNPTSPTTKLNIWVCTIGGGILGYAQFPGGPSATDGVVVDSRHFGLSGSASYPYNLGRTTTHEVGHWMNLRHIWGDAACGTDFVSDTPTHNAANYGAPAYPHYSTCSGTPVEMTMNYMDYTDDRAMYMFTNGQKSRINAIFASGGPRNSFAQP